MFTTLPWQPATALRRHPVASAAATVGLLGAGGYLLFLHLMQTSSTFAEFIANTISPQVADTFACGCPLCSRACSMPTEAYTDNAAQQGLARFGANMPL